MQGIGIRYNQWIADVHRLLRVPQMERRRRKGCYRHPVKRGEFTGCCHQSPTVGFSKPISIDLVVHARARMKVRPPHPTPA